MNYKKARRRCGTLWASSFCRPESLESLVTYLENGLSLMKFSSVSKEVDEKYCCVIMRKVHRPEMFILNSDPGLILPFVNNVEAFLKL